MFDRSRQGLRWPSSVGWQMAVGFALSFLVAGAAVAVPTVLRDDPAPGDAPQPVGPIGVAVALNPVNEPSPEVGPSVPGPRETERAVSPSPQVLPTDSAPSRDSEPSVRPSPSPSPAATTTPAPTGPCAGVPDGSPIAVEPDPVALSSGEYQGSFTIYHCAGDSARWTITKPPSITTSADAGTLEGGASQGIDFSVDPDQLEAGPFHLRVRVSAPGQNIYVDIEGAKPATANIGGLQTEVDSRE